MRSARDVLGTTIGNENDMERLCVYGCRHPWWGGHGTCSSHAESIKSTCLCDEGYISEDSDGNPACVPKAALVGIYAAVAVVSFGASCFLLWQAQEQRRRPTCIQLGKRAVLRLRVIMATRFVCCLWSFTLCISHHKTEKLAEIQYHTHRLLTGCRLYPSASFEC